jgi:hypothetical protein
MLLDPGLVRERITHTCSTTGNVYSDERFTYSDGIRDLVGNKVESWTYRNSGDVLAETTIRRAGDAYFTGEVRFTLRQATDADAVVDAVTAAARPFVGTTHARKLWDVIATQVGRTTPSNSQPIPIAADALAPVYAALYAPATVQHLRRMNQPQKAAALDRIFDRLAPSSAPGAPLAAPPDGAIVDAATEAAFEEPQVSARIRNNSEGGWTGVRRGVLSTFGVMEVGPAAAIGRANAYYGQFVPISLFGYQSAGLVYPTLEARLTVATQSIPESDRATLVAAIKQIGGFWIRPNRNNPASLSLHSFGWAVDINAPENPNVGNSKVRDKANPLHLVEAVTGVDVDRSSTGAQPNYTTGLTAARVRDEVKRLANASRAYVDAMHDDASIAATMLIYLNEARRVEGRAPLSASAAGPILTAARAKAAKPKAVATLMFPTPSGAASPKAALLARRRAAAETLIDLHRTYRASFHGSGRTPAAAIASKGSVAAHGFMNLPPFLVGALSGSDSGRLLWLGTSSVHDFQHFELAPADRPPWF